MATEPNKVIYSMVGVSKYYDKRAVLKDIVVEEAIRVSPKAPENYRRTSRFDESRALHLVLRDDLSE